MASLGHIAVGVATSRIYRREQPAGRAPLASLLFWAALSFLPDADVIGFSFGINYAADWDIAARHTRSHSPS